MDVEQRIVIRGYQSSDKEQCRELWRELTEHHQEIYKDSSIGGEEPGNFFDDHLKSVGPKRIWVAEKDDEEIVGFISVMGKGEEAEIEPIVVKRAYRQQGIGTELLQFAIQESKKLGFSFLSICPVIRNRKAIELFHRVGFQNIGRIELFMELTAKEGRDWNSSLEIFDLIFKY